MGKSSRIGAFAVLLAACALPQAPDTPSTPPTPGGCFATDQTPAVIETRIVDVLVSPAVVAADGTITTPAVFRTETRQTIVQERQNVRFETPCPPVMDVDFLATLQRALKARGHYRGDITSAMDAPTRTAIRSFQTTNGLNSAILSTATARQLGLVT